ncbi:Oleate activated transcription factor 3 [Pleurostoma richardsiae]|uniref:Oleate activated transcription factor 3 n=1 Tax=Pleurostoma richardsiae TaxID=41990 RepID=A0AA38RB34_9PEZI|nr:Oleate activated transcription factor 3 [Pleurostoma richardsiae]
MSDAMQIRVSRVSRWPEGIGDDSGEIVRWSGIDIETQFPGATSLGPWINQWTSAPGSLGPAGLPVCGENCTLHSDAIHDAVRLLQVRSAVPDLYFNDQWHPGKTDEILSWLVDKQQPSLTGHALQMSNPLEDLAHLPIPVTRQNAELLRIFVKLLCRFKACLDGSPDPSNQYIKFYVPFCIQTPLLAQIAIYTAACFLNETGHLDRTVVMSHKGMAIRMLNDHLRSKTATSDEAIAGVTQLIMDEWYWGEDRDLRAHLRGLREMIRLRGGFRSLGLNGLLAKLVISSDVAIALSCEVPPFLQSGPEFEFTESTQVPLRLAFNTPLVASLAPFATCADALDLHSATAHILDDMRFLITAVLSLPSDPSPKELQKICTTSTWIHERISSMPPHSPSQGGRRPSACSTQSDSCSSDPGSQRGRASRRPSPASGHSSQQDNSESSASHSPASSTPPPADQPDILYQAVRQAALIYSRAIASRRPFGAVVSQAQFLQLWTAMWRVPLGAWRSVLGVFGWVVLCITPAARGTPHDRFVKSMLTISLVQQSLEGWAVAEEAMGRAVELQAWLAGGKEEAAGE